MGFEQVYDILFFPPSCLETFLFYCETTLQFYEDPQEKKKTHFKKQREKKKKKEIEKNNLQGKKAVEDHEEL